jgi:DNA-binding winged helix-turn-helix (wHTH) protein
MQREFLQVPCQSLYSFSMVMVCIAVENVRIAQALEQLVEASGYDAVCCVCGLQDARSFPHVIAVGDVPDDLGAVHRFPSGFRLGAVVDRLAVMIAGLQSDPDVVFQDYVLRSQDNMLVKDGNNDSGAIVLTDTEKRLLLALAAAGGEALSRNVLLEKVWGYRPGVDTHTVETHIYRLRRKIEADTAKPVYIMTEADGYKLNI